MEAARSAAKNLIASGAIGDETRSFTVTMSGHSNEGHEPADGWTNDCVTVAIQQAAETKAEGAGAESGEDASGAEE